jgi:hypothetical protein
MICIIIIVSLINRGVKMSGSYIEPGVFFTELSKLYKPVSFNLSRVNPTDIETNEVITAIFALLHTSPSLFPRISTGKCTKEKINHKLLIRLTLNLPEDYDFVSKVNKLALTVFNPAGGACRSMNDQDLSYAKATLAFSINKSVTDIAHLLKKSEDANDIRELITEFVSSHMNEELITGVLLNSEDGPLNWFETSDPAATEASNFGNIEKSTEEKNPLNDFFQEINSSNPEILKKLKDSLPVLRSIINDDLPNLQEQQRTIDNFNTIIKKIDDNKKPFKLRLTQAKFPEQNMIDPKNKYSSEERTKLIQQCVEQEAQNKEQVEAFDKQRAEVDKKIKESKGAVQKITTQVSRKVNDKGLTDAFKALKKTFTSYPNKKDLELYFDLPKGYPDILTTKALDYLEKNI